jgi:hypothetical protein
MSSFDRLLLDSNQVRSDFLKTELSLGLTFADIALSSDDDVKTKRNRNNARTAYEALVKFMGHVSLTPADSAHMANGMALLKSQLQQLGEVV